MRRARPLLVLMLLVIPGTSRAQAGPGSKHEAPALSTDTLAATGTSERAASLFDRGVDLFSRGRYGDAARAFLAADELAPSAGALMNALTAAHQAGDALLTAQTASRALSRAELPEQARTTAREALTLAAPELSTLDIRCAPEPCTLKLDGAAAGPGEHYVRPGVHNLVASFTAGRMTTERVVCDRAKSCSALLEPTDPVAAGPVTKTPTSGSRSQKDATVSAVQERGRGGRRSAAGPDKPLSPAVFAVGCVGTAALAGLTTWSGMRALSERRLHETNPDAYDPDEVRRLQRQTDLLLAGAVALGAATAAAAIWLVDFSPDTRASAAVYPGGVSVAAQTRF